MKIAKKITLPPRPRKFLGKWQRVIKKSKKGQSVLVVTFNNLIALRKACKGMNRKVTSRMTNKGLRCWFVD